MFVSAANSLINECSPNYIYLSIGLMLVYSLVEYIFKEMRLLKEKVYVIESTANTTRALYFNLQKDLNQKLVELEANLIEKSEHDMAELRNKNNDNIINNNYDNMINNNYNNLKKEISNLKLEIESVYNENQSIIQKHNKLLESQNETTYIMLGFLDYKLNIASMNKPIKVPMFINKNSTNIINDMVNNYNNSNVQYNIILSSLEKFPLIKNIELLKLHMWGDIIDDNRKIIWGKSEDTLAPGYDHVVMYIKQIGLKF
jgi:uncharacterized protein YoxC